MQAIRVLTLIWWKKKRAAYSVVKITRLDISIRDVYFIALKNVGIRPNPEGCRIKMNC